MVMLARQRRQQAELAKPATLRGPRKIHVLVLGLDGAGKTTFTYRLLLGRKIVSIPTVGANRENITQTVTGARNTQVRSSKQTEK
jgi:GTPase SAR1 family protein